MTEAERSVRDLEEEKKNLFADPGIESDGLALARRLSAAYDRYFTARYADMPGDLPPFVLVAVGGYGRRELCLHSDVDILILFAEKVPESAGELATSMFVPLWDQGVDLGHGVREIRECLDLAGEDYEVLTSLLDARLICGDSTLFERLRSEILDSVLLKHRDRYLTWLQDGLAARQGSFAAGNNVLEPHLKQGIGGLRDVHHILWVAAARYGATGLGGLAETGSLAVAQEEALQDHLSFLLRVRTWLHVRAGRRTDRLHLELQPELAARLGFEDTIQESGVERFLARLHREMRGITDLCGSFVRIHGCAREHAEQDLDLPFQLGRLVGVSCGELTLNGSPGGRDRLVLALALFEAAARTGLPLAWSCLRFVEDTLFLVDLRFRGLPGTLRTLRTILEQPYAGSALEQMMHSGFLGALIPEFGLVEDKVQFDAYHTFPVGRHSIRAVEILCQESGEFPPDIFSELLEEIGPCFSLRLATLLHDVGKGGEDHARRGGSIAARILDRMRVAEHEAEEVVFLVENHLLLAVTAQSRDLGDEGVIADLAEAVGSVERLKKLMLLTWADARATGPKAWSRWTASLIRELFFKVLHVLTQSSLTGDHAMHQLAVTRDRVRSLGRKYFDSRVLEAWLGAMPQRYLLQYEPADILDHLAVVNEYGDEGKDGPVMRMVQDEESGCWKMTLVTRDTPGLFAVIAGVLALHNIRVYAADLHVWEDGTVLDLFWVSGPVDPLYADEAWERIRVSLQAVLSGKMAIDHRLDKKRKYGFSGNAGLPPTAPRVCLEENGSDFFSVIEVVCDDREGLLYEIARTMQELQLDIVFARIATRKDQVLDVFYVRDRFGEKITDPGQKEEIVRAIEYRIDGA